MLKDCGNILQGILEKIRGKCPLNIDIVRYVACFSPFNMTERKDICISKFAKLVMRMYEGKHLNSQEAEDPKEQFEKFLMEVVKVNPEFKSFDIRKYRLDTFFGKWLHRNTKFEALWKVMKFTFTLIHGQAQIERWFNIYFDILVENVSTPSITSQRAIYDFMKNTNSDPHNLIIDDELRRSCVRVRSKYQEYCEKKKQLEASSVSDQKLEAILNNNATVNRLKQETLQTIQLLEKDAFASYDKAETLKDNAKMQL